MALRSALPMRHVTMFHATASDWLRSTLPQTIGSSRSHFAVCRQPKQPENLLTRLGGKDNDEIAQPLSW